MNEIQSSASRQVSFGPFRLLPYQRLLLQGDQQVFFGSRALDTLTALVGRPGELVIRAELMSRAWPDTVVVPANLTVHVSALRGALGDGKEGHRYVVTVPGRGYRFVTPVAVTEVRMAAAAYAVAKLREANERRELQRRHAKHYRVMLETAVPEGTSPVPTSLLSEIDNVRMALRWAFSREGDPGVGMAIALASIPLWNHRSAPRQSRGWITGIRSDDGAARPDRLPQYPGPARSVPLAANDGI